jgi:hypothetical protein
MSPLTIKHNDIITTLVTIERLCVKRGLINNKIIVASNDT